MKGEEMAGISTRKTVRPKRDNISEIDKLRAELSALKETVECMREEIRYIAELAKPKVIPFTDYIQVEAFMDENGQLSLRDHESKRPLSGITHVEVNHDYGNPHEFQTATCTLWVDPRMFDKG